MEDFYIGASFTLPAVTLSHPMREGLEVRVQVELPRDRGHRAKSVVHNLVFTIGQFH